MVSVTELKQTTPNTSKASKPLQTAEEEHLDPWKWSTKSWDPFPQHKHTRHQCAFLELNSIINHIKPILKHTTK